MNKRILKIALTSLFLSLLVLFSTKEIFSQKNKSGDFRIDMNSLTDYIELLNTKNIRNIDFQNATYNNLSFFLNNYSKLDSIVKIDLEYYSDSIPDDICKIDNLYSLSIYSSTLIELPSSLSRLKGLGNLYLECSKLSSRNVFSVVNNISSLQSIGFRDCCSLNSIPKDIIKLLKLNRLYIACCPIVELPNDLLFMSELVYIYIDRTLLSDKRILELKDINNGLDNPKGFEIYYRNKKEYSELCDEGCNKPE